MEDVGIRPGARRPECLSGGSGERTGNSNLLLIELCGPPQGLTKLGGLLGRGLVEIQLGAGGMGSPMRKRRAWSTFDDDVEARETAALAATVAAAKDRAAESGALLSSAKEDLTDHQRWLRAQSAAVEKDRERHERWLRRQRDQQLATAKKERVSRHRQVMRRRAVQAVRQAFADLFGFFTSWIAFAFGKVAGGLRFLGRAVSDGVSALWRRTARAGASLARVAGRGAASIGLKTRQTAAAAGLRLSQGANAAGASLGKAARGAGEGLAAGAAWSGAKAKASARAGGQAFSAGSQAAAAGAGKFSRTAGTAIGSGLSSSGKKAAALASATGAGVVAGASAAAARASQTGASGQRGLSGTLSWVMAQLRALPPKVYLLVARLSHQVQYFARARAAAPSVASLEPQPADDAVASDAGAASGASVHVLGTYRPQEPSTRIDQPGIEDGADGDDLDADLGAGGSAADVLPGSGAAGGKAPVLSSWAEGARRSAGAFSGTARFKAEMGWTWLQGQGARAGASLRSGAEALVAGQGRAAVWAERWAGKKGLDVSHMVIIAGAILLVVGGLLIGGGLLMRASSDPVIAAETPDETFSKISWLFDQPERPLPERAVFTLSGTPKAFLINGLSIGGVNNSDETLSGLEAIVSPDVRRPDLRLDVAPGLRSGEKAAETAPAVGTTVQPGEAFRLVFPFPPEAMGEDDGISPEDFFESYGGLMLTLRYEADGVEKTIIQYLAPETLKSQLDEVSEQAGNS